MPFYESVFIARQEISPQQVDSIAESLQQALEEKGGKVTKKEDWGLKNLAYRIKKSRKGHYTLLNIDAPSSAVHEMERQMRLNEDIVRYLTIRVNRLDDEPSVQVKLHNSRSEDTTDNGEFRARSVEEISSVSSSNNKVDNQETEEIMPDKSEDNKTDTEEGDK